MIFLSSYSCKSPLAILSLSNHRGHPWLLKYSSDFLISLSDPTRFVQSDLASHSTCLEKQHKLSSLAVDLCLLLEKRSVLSRLFFLPFLPNRQQTAESVLMCLSSHCHLKLSLELDWHRQVSLLVKCTSQMLSFKEGVLGCNILQCTHGV